MKRILPKEDCGLLIPLMPRKTGRVIKMHPAKEGSYAFNEVEVEPWVNFEEEYIAAIEAFERTTEHNLKDLLERIGVRATTKTDRYSLPYKWEVTKNLRESSFLNDAFDVRSVFRNIIGHILERDITKLRFYMCIDIVIPKVEQPSLISWITHRPFVEYKFRYY